MVSSFYEPLFIKDTKAHGVCCGLALLIYQNNEGFPPSICISHTCSMFFNTTGSVLILNLPSAASRNISGKTSATISFTSSLPQVPSPEPGIRISVLRKMEDESVMLWPVIPPTVAKRVRWETPPLPFNEDRISSALCPPNNQLQCQHAFPCDLPDLGNRAFIRQSSHASGFSLTFKALF